MSHHSEVFFWLLRPLTDRKKISEILVVNILETDFDTNALEHRIPMNPISEIIFVPLSLGPSVL